MDNNKYGKSINVADKLQLPKSYITDCDFISGIRGYGKSYCVNVIEEQMMLNNWPFIVIDPMGIHYSLRQEFDKLLILGGEHGDYKNHALVYGGMKYDINTVIDLSGETLEEQRFICGVILNGLKDLQIEIKKPIKVIIEECDIFIPQGGGNKECKDAIKWLARKGRQYGVGMTLICQRYASVDKEVVTQVDNFLMFRTRYVNDLNNIKKMVDVDGINALKSTRQGQCLCHSPYYEGIINVNKRICKHAGDTPELGVEREEIVLKDLNWECKKQIKKMKKYEKDDSFLERLVNKFK